ncbi:hypothetical protein Esti_005539 [Eimeria stiedai]
MRPLQPAVGPAWIPDFQLQGVRASRRSNLLIRRKKSPPHPFQPIRGGTYLLSYMMEPPDSSGSSGSSTGVGSDPSTSLWLSVGQGELGEVLGAQLPADVQGTDGLDEEHVRLETASGKEPAHRAFVKKAAGFAEIADGFLESRRRRGTSAPASLWTFHLPGRRVVQLVLLMVLLVHFMSLLFLLKKTVANVAQSQKPSVGARFQDEADFEPEEEEPQQPPDELRLELPVDDEHMNKYERQLGRESRMLQKAWVDADLQTQQIFARLFTPGRDAAGALQPFLQLEETVMSFKRPSFADLEGFGEHLRSRWNEEAANEDQTSKAQEGRAEAKGAADVQDGLKQKTELSKEAKARAEAIGQGTSFKRGLELGKAAPVREKFESYVRFVIALNRMRIPQRKAESFEESGEENEDAEQDDEESGEEYDLTDSEALDSENERQEDDKQAGAHEASGAEQAGIKKSKRSEETQGNEEVKETNKDVAQGGGDFSFVEKSSGEASSDTKHEFGQGGEASGEEQQAHDAEPEGERTIMKFGRAARLDERAKEKLVSEANESRKVYAARLKLVTALMKAARRRIRAIGVSLSFVSQHRVSSPLYGLRGYPMPSLELLKRKPRQPAGYSKLYEQLQDRIFPAPESDAPDSANVPLELIDRLVNAVRLSDLLIEQDQGVAASFSQFFRVVRRSKGYDEEAADLEHLGAGSQLPMDPGGHVVFPVALFRAVVGNLKALHDLSFITDETIGDWSQTWTIDHVWAQTYKLSDTERERTAALHRIKQSLRKSWSAVQGKAVADDDAFLLALYLL